MANKIIYFLTDMERDDIIAAQKVLGFRPVLEVRHLYEKYLEFIEDITLFSLQEQTKRGNVDAIRTLIEQKGGWSLLTAAQKDKVFQLLLRYDISF